MTRPLMGDTVFPIFYASPEQLAKPSSPSAHLPTTDIYAFGQLCYYTVTSSDPVPLKMANNAKAISERLNRWRVVEASIRFMELYTNCSHEDRKKRYQSFDEICNILFDIAKCLKDIDPNEIISSERFIDELIFSIIGLLPDNRLSNTSFISLSSSIRAEIKVKKEDKNTFNLNIFITPTAKPILEGKSKSSDMRNVLKRRIDNFLSGFSKSSRHPGIGVNFNYTLNIGSVPKSLTGVQEVRKIMTGLIDIHESL